MSDVPFAPSKKGRKKFFAGCFIAFVAIIMMSMMIVPGGPADRKVSASFTHPLYTDTYIENVIISDGNNSVIYNWGYLTNPNDAPSVAVGIDITFITVVLKVNTARLAPGGTVYDHMNVYVRLNDPASNTTQATTLSSPVLSWTDGSAIKGYTYYFTVVGGYDLSAIGTYYISTTFSIEIP